MKIGPVDPEIKGLFKKKKKLTQAEHWRRQLWGTGARTPSTYNNVIFSMHFDLYKVWQRPYVDSCLL